MNISAALPDPLNTFVVDVPEHTYYDFELDSESSYPLRGVTYPVDYGNIPGYTGEDGHELDFYIGEDVEGLLGYIVVYRGETIPDEHKFYIGLTDDDLQKILTELGPVLIEQSSPPNISVLLNMVDEYKND